MKYNILITIILVSVFTTGESKEVLMQNNSRIDVSNLIRSHEISKLNISEAHGRLNAGELVFIDELDKSACPTDNNGKPCAHIIVEISLPDVGFESDMIIKSEKGYEIETIPGQYSFWVSTSGNTKKKSISIAHSNYYSTVIPLSCDGKSLQPQREYRVKVKTPAPKGTVIFSSEYTKDYSLYIDGDLFESATNGMISISLPSGVYSYTIQSDGRGDIIDSIKVIEGKIVEKELSLIPIDRFSEDYVKYRIYELFNDSSNRISFITPSFSELYYNCSDILEEFPSLLEDSEFMWFLNDADRIHSKLRIEQFYFNSNYEATATIKLEFPVLKTLKLIMKYSHNDWYLDDIQKEDSFTLMYGSTSEVQQLTAKGAFQSAIDKYNQYKIIENEPSEYVCSVLNSLIDIVSIDEEFQESDVQDVLILKKLKNVANTGEVIFYWTYNCETTNERGHILPSNYGKESIFVEESQYRAPAECLIVIWKKENISILEDILPKHKWIKKGTNKWIRKAPKDSYENDKCIIIEEDPIYGIDAFSITVTQFGDPDDRRW